MKDEKKAPKLRFKGFTDDWEQRRLSEIVTEHNSGVYIAKDEYGSGTNIIGVGDIYESDLVDGQVFRLAPVNDEKFILHSRDLLYGESSLVQEGIARVVSVTDKGAGTAFAWHTRRFIVEPAVADSQFVMLELNYWFPARKHLMRTATKTALTGITTQDFFSTNILVPILLEQKKICDLLRRLDNLIAANQRKLDLLKEQKKGYLQKMFPKNGAKVPELRFAGFADDWEERKLGELGKIYTGNTPKTSDLDNWTDNKEGHIWITPTDIDKLIISDSDRHLSERGWSKARKIPENSVLITSIASIGKNAINAVPVAFNQQINAIVPEKNDSYFILSAMTKDTARFASVAGQTATSIINKTTFEKFQIATPSYEEQQKIGSFFKQLDDTIDLHQRKLEKLRELKKGYLQKMFC